MKGKYFSSDILKMITNTPTWRQCLIFFYLRIAYLKFVSLKDIETHTVSIYCLFLILQNFEEQIFAWFLRNIAFMYTIQPFDNIRAKPLLMNRDEHPFFVRAEIGSDCTSSLL